MHNNYNRISKIRGSAVRETQGIQGMLDGLRDEAEKLFLVPVNLLKKVKVPLRKRRSKLSRRFK